MTSRDKIWYLAQTKPNSAKIAEMNLNRQDFHTFLPMIEKTIRHNGKFVEVKRPLFSGYIFVAVDTVHTSWSKINSTYGISRLVSFNEKPSVVPQSLVFQLMQHFYTNTKLQPPNQFKPGDNVALISGPFVDFVAEVEKTTPNQRVWLLIEIMGSQTRVAIGADHLRNIYG